jgi:transcriptional regulator with XRE-family HTH domain
MDIDPEVGRRVEALRRRSGMSRERLASLTGLSPTTIKFIETARRALTLRAAQRIAPVLGVRDLSDLFGPAIQLSLDGRPSHPGVPEVRRALTAWPLRVEGQPASPEYLRGAVDSTWRTWHTSARQRTEIAGVLPGLISEAQRATRLHEGADRRRSLAMLAETYHQAQAFLAWHGDRELMWLCVDKGMAAAIEADDPLAIGGASWYAAHLLRAVGSPDEAIARLDEARDLLAPLVSDESPAEYTAMIADLLLCRALTRARSGDDGAWHDWDTARGIVHDTLPADYIGPWTRVGRTLVDVYAVMCAVDLGEPEEAQRRAHSLDPASIPSTDRRARHYVELARGTDLEGSVEGTLHLLQRAAATSTETVAYSPAARELVGRLVASSGASIRADAEELARQVGVDLA